MFASFQMKSEVMKECRAKHPSETNVFQETHPILIPVANLYLNSYPTWIKLVFIFFININVQHSLYSSSRVCRSLYSSSLISFSLQPDHNSCNVRWPIFVAMGQGVSGISRSYSASPATHYTLKLESFSMLKELPEDHRCESDEFQAGGYKWKLVVFPYGNKKKNVEHHISINLEMARTDSLQPDWEVYVDFRVYLLDQEKGTYVVFQDDKIMQKCLHGVAPDVGFNKLISLKELTDASNGYVINDTCVFGAEVFVRKERRAGKGTCISMIKNAAKYTHVWKIKKFSKLKDECYYSKPFTAGNQRWKIMIYPKGNSTSKGTHFSLYLTLADTKTLHPRSQILTKITLRIVHQMHHRLHCCISGNFWFSASQRSWGQASFITLVTLNEADEGFLMNNTCIVEADVTVVAIAKAL
ncbi:hypothetical protein ACFXTN_020064 [Malus domestica]